MNENINLCELLKGHKGEIFYSPVFGYMTLNSVGITLCLELSNGEFIDLCYNGKYIDEGEICIFPSKDQRDWLKWVAEQKPKEHKTYSELTSYRDDFIKISSSKSTNNAEKALLAFVKICQVIESGYGGNITNEEWDDEKLEKFIIVPTKEGFKIDHRFKRRAFRHIAFHTKAQAEEFLYYPENVNLLKYFYMI